MRAVPGAERLKMIKARRDGLYLLLIGCVVLILLGAALENGFPSPMVDFRGLYYPAKCLIEHHDPYIGSEVRRIYQAEGVGSPLDNEKVVQIATSDPYPPTAFALTVPFALLPWGPAHLLWIALTIGSLVLASFLTWSLAEKSAPVLSGVLIGFLLANSELLIITGNMAGIAISLCVVAVWCFLRERFVPAGILCLAISLAIKPHDAGLVWLYFLLVGGVYRKRALQTLLAVVVLGLPVVLWVWQVSPHWLAEMQSNILAYSARGAINDPGPASSGAHGLGMLVSLQAVIGILWDDPRIYNTVSYLVCAPLLLVWGGVTLRSQPSPKRAWLALAAIASLTMLPVYHRQMDTKLLLLTVPACAMLWAQGDRIGRLALLVTTAGFVLTGDIPWAIFLGLIGKLHLPATALTGQMLMAVQVFPVPLILLVMGVFYLWVYARSGGHPALIPRSEDRDLGEAGT
ncbi:MAG: glycosyltransferase family 87 protein [Terracidiphilus sp.]